MPLPLRNNQSVDDDAYNEYNQLPGESFYPYPIDATNQFQSSSMPADDYTLQSHEYEQQLQSQSKVKPSEPQKFEAANLSNWVKNGGSIYNNASNIYNDASNNSSMSSYDNVSATDWVDCDLSGADVKRIGFKHRIPSGLLFIILGIIIAVLCGRAALAVKQSNGGLAILVPIIMSLAFLIIFPMVGFGTLKGNTINYDMSNAVGVNVKALLNETGFERICVEPDNYYYHYDNIDDDYEHRVNKYNIKLITMIPRPERHHYNIYAYNSNHSKAVRALLNNTTVNGISLNNEKLISLILETEGQRVRLLIPDNQDDTTDSSIARNVINSIYDNGISKENIGNTIISTAVSKAKHIGSHQKDQYIRYNYGTVYLADSFNDMDVDGKTDDVNE